MSQREEEITNMKQMIEEAQERAEEYQAELEEGREADRLEDELIEVRRQNRASRDVIKDMEAKYREMIDKWKHNENVYRTVSHNFKFDFLPRLAAERDELKQKIDRFKGEEEEVGGEIEAISGDIVRIEQNNKELRLKVEELTFEQRLLKNQISKQDDTLGGKQRELSRYQTQIRSGGEDQQQINKQIKLLQTTKDRVEKKLKWGVNDLKEAKNAFSVAKARLVECYAQVTEKVDRIRNFQKDLMSCVLEDNFDIFIDKFTNLINSYAHITYK
ncbi:uncharacterized protein LOC134854888 [Symsagittifera roscoffensis]|uniref:uncharacterized protein LOC134854888 n=1 Tax=Symsagittifera roscoffensis TaxID=84072 RepID=UPI00307B453F